MQLSSLTLLAPLLLVLSASLRADVVSDANTALQAGRVEVASATLSPWLAQHPSDAAAHLILCRVLYAQELPDSAIRECEAATSNAPSSSEAHLWLGRAYGAKASNASAFVAFSLARKVRDAFERAVQLDPNSLPALSDLGEFYVAAPAVVGGSSGKAGALASRLHNMNQPAAEAQSHRILGMLAEKNGDQTAAEEEFRRATAGHLAPAWVDLGAFYVRRHQPDQAVAAIQTAISLDKTRGPVLVDAASVLSEAGREPDLARRLLLDYIGSPTKSDAAPVFKVYLQLGNLLAKSGDAASAHKQFTAAAALAPSYAPARKAASAQTVARAR